MDMELTSYVRAAPRKPITQRKEHVCALIHQNPLTRHHTNAQRARNASDKSAGHLKSSPVNANLGTTRMETSTASPSSAINPVSNMSPNLPISTLLTLTPSRPHVPHLNAIPSNVYRDSRLRYSTTLTQLRKLHTTSLTSRTTPRCRTMMPALKSPSPTFTGASIQILTLTMMTITTTQTSLQYF